jgi:hypothetical protein
MSDLDNEFSELVCIADTRERMQSRINRMEAFITSKGGLFDRSKLDLCDYHIEGYFREKAVNIGIEYKTFIDYNSSKEDLNDKLFRSGKLYDTIALFIEENGLSLAHGDNGTFVKIMQVPDERANITNYHAYKNHLDSLSFDGIHVRTFQHEAFFIEDVYSLLLHLSKDCHKGLHIKGNDYDTQFCNALCKLDGMGPVGTFKITNIVPNLAKLVEYSHFDGLFEKIIGPIHGKQLRQFVLNSSNVQECHARYVKKYSQLPKSKLSGGGAIISSSNPPTKKPPANNTSQSPGAIPDDMGGATIPNHNPPGTPQKPSPKVAEVDPPSSVTALENNIFNYCSERRPFMNIMSTFTFQGIKSVEIHRAINNLEVGLKLSKTVEGGDTVYYQNRS